MLIVKIMSGEDTHDTDPRKSFMLHAGVVEAHFERRGDGTNADPRTHTQPWLTLRFSRQFGDRVVDDAISLEPSGNVYVMNEAGKTVASYGVAPIIYADEGPAADAPDAVKAMVERFLRWRLPENFNPDNGVSFKPPAEDRPNRLAEWPTGTNLFDYTQAEGMVRHILGLEPKA